MTATLKHRILITVEGGVIQNIENIPSNIVIEVRDFDRDGEREHPTWSEEHQAFVGEWEGEQSCITNLSTRYHYERSTSGTEETFDILNPDGSPLVSVPFWYDAGTAEATAKLITNALNLHADQAMAGIGLKPLAYKSSVLEAAMAAYRINRDDAGAFADILSDTMLLMKFRGLDAGVVLERAKADFDGAASGKDTPCPKS